MKQEYVNNVEKNIQQTNILKPKLVQYHVQTDCVQEENKYVKIKKVSYIGKEDVYNMEVKDHHNFSVNGGLVVHNCLDALRYAMESVKKNGSMMIMK